jgi:hypothetical protein
MTSKAKYIEEVVANDPDTGEKVLLSIYKDSKSGKLIGLESSFTDDLSEGDVLNSPYINDSFEIIQS